MQTNDASIAQIKLFKTFGEKRVAELAAKLGDKERINAFFNYQDGKACDEYGEGEDYERYRARADKTKAELLTRVNGHAQEPEHEPEPESAKQEQPNSEPHGESAPQPLIGDVPLHVLVASVIRKQATLFHDSEERGYLRYRVKGHVETHAIDSIGFHRYAMYLAFTVYQQTLGREAMSSLTALLNAEAVFDGDLRKVERRVAHRGGVYYVDICDPDWHVIEVVPGQGWTVIASDKNPICFIRSRNTQALPMPERGASIEALWDYVNIPEADRMRVLTWILETFRPETQYPILALKAEAGSGKTETEKTLRLLTDPNKALTSRAPNSTRDVLSNAQNNHVLAFDNMSVITDSLSDLLCCMATGSGHRERRLYTNLEEEVVELKRPVMFDGIEFLARRDDLVDRLIHVELPPLKRDTRISEHDFRSQRKADLPVLLGALLDLFVDAIARVESIQQAQSVRMMDYAKLGQAVCDSLGKEVDFAAELRHHQAALKHRALDDSPFLMRLLEVLDNAATGQAMERNVAGDWTGADVTECRDGTLRFVQYPGKLLERMSALAKEQNIRTTSWPQKPNGVIGVLDRNKVALHNLGFTYRKEGTDNRGTRYSFKYDPKSKNAEPPENVDEK